MPKLLIVDDDEISRGILSIGFMDVYETIEVSNGQKAMELLLSDIHVDAVIMDLHMPIMDGFDVLRAMNKTKLISRVPVFIISGTEDTSELLLAYDLGACDVVKKPYNLQFLRRRVNNTIELYESRQNLQEIIDDKSKELVRQNNRLVEALADIVEFRSNESGLHVKRVRGYTQILMEHLVRECDQYRYLEKEVETIAFAACLHDLGKIAIPDGILNKPGRLTDDEYTLMKNHTVRGYEHILYLKDIMDRKLFEYSLDICRHHHERYDGNGYPDKLKGDEISIWSQVVSLADVYDALTNERCYKETYDSATAVNMILSGECGSFNPMLLDIFRKCEDQFRTFLLTMGNLQKWGEKQTVLLVEPNDNDRNELDEIISRDFDVTKTTSGEDAVRLISNNPNSFSAIVIALDMPGMDGVETVEKLGKDYIRANPIVFISSNDLKESVTRAGTVGITAIINKPFDSDRILKKIHFVIQLKNGY